ncbi:hypothetical protein [Nocardia sp. NPDC051832]|uniref:RNA polymerase sigma factor n=1 Tax=Nocardia sp. NPDC051832 TaxID=3155673 RepID=UPI003418DCA0
MKGGSVVMTGFREGDQALRRWLGGPINNAPPTQRAAVFEYVLGVGLAEASAYAAQKAYYVLGDLDADMRHTYEDIAQDVILSLTEKLPVERIQHWRGLILRYVTFRVLHERRRRLAGKRHPGDRVEYDDALTHLSAISVADDDYERLVMREQLRAALEAVPDPEIRAVLQATFVILPGAEGCDVRTTAEVAKLLEMSQPKVKRLRAAGVPILRGLLEERMNK